MLGPLSAERDTAFRATLAVAVVLLGLLRGIGMQLVSTSDRSLDAAVDEVVGAAVALLRQGLGRPDRRPLAGGCDRGYTLRRGSRRGRPGRNGA